MSEQEKDLDLAAALSQYSIPVAPEQAARLDRFRRLVWQWNEKINLTRHTTIELFVTRDILDSFQMGQLLEPGWRVLDMGSGYGVPGAVVQILRPDVRVELCECIGKKARVLQEICRELELSCPVYAERVEQVLQRADRPYDAVIARAVGPLWKMLQLLRPYWHSFGHLYVIKGPQWLRERGEARHRGMMQGLNLRRAAIYANPMEKWRSVILHIWPDAEFLAQLEQQQPTRPDTARRRPHRRPS